MTMGIEEKEKPEDFVPVLSNAQKKERIAVLSRALYPNHVAGLINWYVGTASNIIEILYEEISAHATQRGIELATNDDGFLEIRLHHI
jgi:hypothetical protein